MGSVKIRHCEEAMSTMNKNSSFPLIEVSGTPYERGYQHGQQAADRVRLSVAIYARALSSFDFPRDRRDDLINSFRVQIEDFEPAFIEEMQGIADGANVGFEDILMINARTEIVSQARLSFQANLHPDQTEASDECTSVAVLPKRSANGRLLQGQNWDNRVDCADTIIILRVLREDGPDVMTFVEAGGLARYGLNSAGIVLNGNGMSCSRDYSQNGIPLPLVRRKALEQEHYAIALQIIAATPKACSCNIMLGSSLGLSINLECAPDETFLQYPDGDLLVHANHWTSAIALSKLKETGIKTSPDSLYRDIRLRQTLMAVSRPIELDDLKQALGDSHASPYSLCRPPRMSNQGYQSSTTATLLMEPESGSMEVARLPFLGARYAAYSMVRGSKPVF